MSKNKIAIAFALFLMFAMALSLVALPAANAHTPPETWPTFAYISLSANPVGEGQHIDVVMWITPNPPTAEGLSGDRWRGITVEVTKPNGDTETLGPFNSDPTGSTFASYVPDQVGQYKFEVKYPGQVLSLYSPDGIPTDLDALAIIAARTGQPDKALYINDTFQPSSATTDLTVQQEPIPAIPNTPLPTQYWTRPIYGQNSNWESIASNWLSGSQIGQAGNLWQAGTGPSSPHVMWTKQIETGGIVGGTTGASSYQIPDVGFYSGGSYEGRFANALIIDGKLYYADPLGHSATGGGYTCVDLTTGELVWHSDQIAVTVGSTIAGGPTTVLVPSFGQLFDYESQNQHGVVGGLLWAVSGSTWSAYDAFTGKWCYNLTNVPFGTQVYTDTGAIVQYVFNYNTASKAGWLALWNNTQHNAGLELTPAGGNASVAATTEAYQWRPNGRSIDMGQPYAYSWNVTISADLSGLGQPTIVKAIPGDIILGTSTPGSTPGIAGFFSVGVGGTENPYTIWALSDKPETRGQLLWIHNYTAPAGISRTFGAFGSALVDTVNRVFFMQQTEDFAWLGYNLDTGNLLWGPTIGATRAYSYFGSGLGGGQLGFAAYGKLFTQGFGGEICCFDGANGTLLWKFNNTNSGVETAWGNYPIFICAICDGKVYAFNNEHSPNYPLYKGEKIYCINATTGEEIYSMLSWAGQSGGPGTETSILADGYLVYYNYYDNQIYCVGKGPSATSVTAPDVGVTTATPVTIRGTVTDISAGSQQEAVAANFPNGLPCVSDASMSAWMEYAYMQQPKPTNTTGVKVTVSVLDSNGNQYNIGTTTTNAMGVYGLTWTPPIPGNFTIYANFGGTESYYPSAASTILYASAAPTATPAPTPPPASLADIYFLPMSIVILIAVIVVGLLIVLMLRRR
jgi:hypothetical protein